MIMKSVLRYGSIVYFLLSAGILSAQPDSSSQKRVRVIAFPVVSYSPETKFGFGGLAAANFNTSPDSLTTASYAQTFLLYTINRQYNIDQSFRMYTAENKAIWQGKFSYTYFPELYFGVETEHPKVRRDLIEYNRLSGELKVYRSIRRHTYTGVAARYSKIYNIFSAPGGSFSIDRPLGHTDHQVLGFAPLLAFENRDSQVNPGKGWYAELQVMSHPDWLHQSFRFVSVRLEARKYYSTEWLSKRDVFAFQFFALVNSGDVPFKSMAEIGGPVVMRGYYTGYFRYKNLYAFQVEYRASLWKLIGLNAWLGAAATPRHWYSVGDSGIKPNAGLGLRFMINEKDKLNLRADYGFGKQQQGFYLDIAEAF